MRRVKEIISFCVAVALLVSASVTAFAETTSIVEIVNSKDAIVINTDKTAEQIIYIYNKGDASTLLDAIKNNKLRYFEVADFTKESGKHTLIIPKDGFPAGTYGVCVGDEETILNYNVTNDLEQIVRELVAVDGWDSDKFQNNLKYFYFGDYSVDYQACASEIEGLVKAGVNPADNLQTFDSKVNANSAYAMAKKGKIVEPLVTDSAISIFDESAQKLYNSLGTTEKKAVIKNVADAQPSSFNGYLSEMKSQIALYGMKNSKDASGEEARLILEEYAQDFQTVYAPFNMSAYNNLELTQRARIMKDYADLQAKPQTVADLYSFITSEVAKYSKTNNGDYTGPGGGGVSGGGFSSVPTNMVYVEPVEPGMFTDENETPWAIEAIEALANAGYVSGYDDGSFKPNNKISRAEVASMIVRMLSLEATDEDIPFTDIDASFWGKSAIIAAFNNGIVSGVTETSFAPNAQITRQDMATMLYNACKDSLPESTRTAEFTDTESISSYAEEAVKALYGVGIINGREDGSFDPKANCTRAEVSVMLYNYLKLAGLM